MKVDILNPLIKMLQMIYLIVHYLSGQNCPFSGLRPWV